MFLLGIDELGIYRVSGVSSDVKRLKEKFDESKFLSLFSFATMMHGDDGMMAVMMVIMMVLITMMV